MSSGDKFDLISSFNSILNGRVNNTSQGNRIKKKTVRVKALANAEGFTSLPPLRLASAQQCLNVASAVDVNGDGIIDFDDFMNFVGLAIHQLTVQKERNQSSRGRRRRLSNWPERKRFPRRHRSQQQRRHTYSENSDDEMDFEEA